MVVLTRASKQKVVVLTRGWLIFLLKGGSSDSRFSKKIVVLTRASRQIVVLTRASLAFFTYKILI